MAGASQADPSKDSTAYCVLVVEDDEELRRVVVRHLTRWGFAALEAPDGGAALDEFRKAGDALDVILLDIMLPVLNGVDVARYILAERPGTPIIAYSAAFNDQIESDLRDLGVEDLLYKPFRAENLHTLLRRAITATSG